MARSSTSYLKVMQQSLLSCGMKDVLTQLLHKPVVIIVQFLEHHISNAVEP